MNGGIRFECGSPHAEEQNQCADGVGAPRASIRQHIKDRCIQLPFAVVRFTCPAASVCACSLYEQDAYCWECAQAPREARSRATEMHCLFGAVPRAAHCMFTVLQKKCFFVEWRTRSRLFPPLLVAPGLAASFLRFLHILFPSTFLTFFFSHSFLSLAFVSSFSGSVTYPHLFR